MKHVLEPIQLRVAEAKARDVGKRRARVSSNVLEMLQASAGDVVELVGKRSTVAIVWNDEDIDDHTIRIDGQTRKNAGVGINDMVTVRRVEAKAARSITLVPLSLKMSIDREFSEFVKSRLRCVPVVEGDEISVIILGSAMDFRVQKVTPKGIVRIEHSTRLSILSSATVEKKPRVTYEDIGGLRAQIERLREIVELPLKHPEVFQRLGIEPPKGILLYGPPGCGKTLIAKALASEAEANFYSINGPEIMNKYYGETEARLREIFKEAKENAPGIIFIDEIDAIAPKREEVFGDVEKRVVAQLLALMDGLADRGNVIVIGATNRPESVDPALRRPGRFDREIEITVPNAEGRLEILQIHTRGMPLAESVNLKRLASELHGYTGADIKALCREAAMKALRRYLPEIDLEGESISPELLEKMVVTGKDFHDAMKEIVPTALREFYVEGQKVTWGDVGGMRAAKKLLYENIVKALREPERFEEMGITPPTGALLYGPPGCGKTLLALALANESGANSIKVKGPEVLSKWVGESEKAIRDIYKKARASSPCVVIFDELDAIARPRAGEGSEVNDRVLSQLLTEMDNVVHGVITIGITNRPDLIDPSLLRPGRLDMIVYVQPPSRDERLEILQILTRRMPIQGDGVNLEEMAERTNGYTGADLNALCREAAINAMMSGRRSIDGRDFEHALKQVRPSITPQIEGWYNSISKSVTYAMPKPIDKVFYG
ncbi:MAG: CDC48 family AAA ATPase [Candidatus Nitrosocaldus sp.]|nr:CDC48 family AAA ATPase [Candidatus Nitrosocaldus sp.]MDW8275305.1 CDC48 family AAA ATPase [Candidatus Nitrosocaldus sp.]